VARNAVRFLRLNPAVASTVLSPEWVTACAMASTPSRRELAAVAISVRGGIGKEHLGRLLGDPDPRVCAAAFHAAAALREREYVDTIIARLADPHLRRHAVEALAAFGSDITGTLGDIMQDENVPAAVRVQIPRVFRNIPEQRSVDVLLCALDHADVPVRGAILRALNHLRGTAPGLDYGPAYIAGHVLREARHYCELHAQLAAVAQSATPRTATGLLARTLEDRASATLERLFRLLGLRYPPGEIQAAYRSLQANRTEETVAALDLLENVLEHSLRRVVLPLLETEGSIVEKGRDLFSIEVDGAESALRELIQQGDAWLVACAVATAAEQGLRQLRPEIEEAADRATPDVRKVARSAVKALA
jgi:AAA family ATP:ADP antiporter